MAVETATKYKIINTTIKPKRIDPVTKKDLRTAIERNGHPVSFPDVTTNQPVLVTQDRPRIVDQISPGLEGLARGGYIRIEVIKDVVTALRQHTYKPEPKPADGKKADGAKGQEKEEEPAEDLFSPDVFASEEYEERKAATEKSDDSRTAKASEMGVTSAMEEGINPDGKPNYEVTAPRGKQQRKSKRSR